MANNKNLIPIPGRLHSVATEGHVSGADEIYDDTQQKDQKTINSELIQAVGTGGSIDSKIAAAKAEIIGNATSACDTLGEAEALISAETSARQSAISNVIGDAASDYNTLGKLEDKIQAEATRAEAAEEALDGRIDTLEEAVGSGGSVDERIAEAVENAAFLGANDDSAVIANFDPQTDTVWKKAQTLSNAEKSQVKTNLGLPQEIYSKTEVNNLITTPNQQYVTVATYASLPGTGSADTIYRVSNYNGSTNQVDATMYSEYAWNGSDYTFLCVKSQIGEVFDITAYNSNTKYADLAAALGTNGANVPEGVRKGGMSVKYVSNSDNTYVQYRLMDDDWNIDINEWQGVDDEPIRGSKNLVKSGGVDAALKELYEELPNNQEGSPLADFDIADEERNTIVRFSGGHLKTKNFNSETEKFSSEYKSKVDSIEFGAQKNDINEDESENADLDFADENKNVVLRLKEGHIQTKEFDSRRLRIEDSYTNLDFADEDKNVVLRVEEGNIKTKNFDSTHLRESLLRGKKILYCGDSLMSGLEYAVGSDEIVWGLRGRLDKKYNLISENLSYGGACIGGIFETGGRDISIAGQIGTYVGDCDICLFNGGHNDFFHSKFVTGSGGNEGADWAPGIGWKVTRGTLPVNYPFNGSYFNIQGRPTETIPALEWAIARFKKNNPNAILIYVMNWKGGNHYNELDQTVNNVYDCFFKQIIEVLNKYSIPYIDLYHNSGFSLEYYYDRMIYGRNNGQYGERDYIHPSTEGYDKLFPLVEKGILDILSYIVPRGDDNYTSNSNSNN